MTCFKLSGKNMKWILLTFSATLWMQTIQAQNFTIKRIEQTPDDIIIYYDLETNEKQSPHLVQVFSSTDNFLNPLMKVSGDVGIDVKPGANRKIIWNVKKELGSTFNGDVQLELRGKKYAPFITMGSIGKNQMIKRTKKTEFTWTGDTNKKRLMFTLFRNEEVVTGFPNISNTGKTKISLPAKVKPGSGYYFMITEVGNTGNIVKTEEFTVKKRIPVVVKFVPAVIAVGVVILLLPEKERDVVGIPLGPPSGN